MKIGVRLHDFGKSNPVDLAKKAKDMGFDGVQLVINKAFENQSGMAQTMDDELLTSFAKPFFDQNLDVALLGSYFNPVHSDKKKVNDFVLKFKDHLRFAHIFNCPFVGTETGSFNDDSWTYNPLNRTEDAYNEVKTIFSDILKVAFQNKTYMAVEGAYGHCMYCPKQLRRLYDDINNGYLKIIVDVYNYLSIDNYQNHVDILKECLELFPNEIVIFHLKDFIVEQGKLVQVGLGKGIMRWDIMLPLIEKSCPHAYLIFEGVKKEDMASSLEYVHSILK